MAEENIFHINDVERSISNSFHEPHSGQRLKLLVEQHAINRRMSVTSWNHGVMMKDTGIYYRSVIFMLS